jgi:hypothetical protein
MVVVGGTRGGESTLSREEFLASRRRGPLPEEHRQRIAAGMQRAREAAARARDNEAEEP